MERLDFIAIWISMSSSRQGVGAARHLSRVRLLWLVGGLGTLVISSAQSVVIHLAPNHALWRRTGMRGASGVIRTGIVESVRSVRSRSQTRSLRRLGASGMNNVSAAL